MNKIHNWSRGIRYCLIVTLSCATLNAQQRKEIRPKQFVSLVHMTGDRDFVYYALSEKNKTTIEVEGPGKLIVFNRARLEENERFSQPYYLKYIRNGQLIQSKTVGPQAISKKVKYKGKLKGTPSKADKEVIKIPPGKHQLSFFKHKARHNAHVRFVFEAQEKLDWKEIQSVNALERVGIQHSASGKHKEYFRIDSNRKFQFTATGQKKIRVYIRGDFNYRMHAQNVIRLVLLKDGIEEATYKLTCRRSQTVEFVNEKKLIPGTLRKVYIEIENTTTPHQYELYLKDTSKSALIRVALGNDPVKPI
ncbi:MAG: hypothetical protein AAFP76_00755 [Bacteroidota bacterium]